MKTALKAIAQVCVNTAEVAAPVVNVLSAVTIAAEVGTAVLAAPKVIQVLKHIKVKKI